MKAILVHAFGGPEVLKFEEVPTPRPAVGQVLVRIHAAGVNPYDTYMRNGTYPIKPPLPYTPGSDAWLTKPRTLNLDASGQLWIGTDQRGRVSDTADGLFIMQTAGPSTYLLDTAYLAPIGAAIGGAAFDAASKTVFASVRHPGATPSASFDAPATRWPTLQPTMPPQTTVIGLVSA